MLIGGMISFGGADAYRANAVVFDGTNDYLTHGSLTGAADSKKLTVSFWRKGAATTGRLIAIEDNSGNFAGAINLNDDGSFALFFNDSPAGTTVLNMKSDTPSDTSAWNHFAASVDLTDTGKRHMLINGTASINTVSTYSNTAMDLTAANNTIGGRSDGTGLVGDDLSEVFIEYGLYQDLLSSNPFYDSGNPVDPGDDGSGYGLGVPIVMLSGPTDTWHTNNGDGGGFTENGALTTASTSPSD